MSYGIKISKENNDVNTANDRDLVFSSEWNNWKVKQAETTTLTLTGSSSNTRDITHSLGYIPTVYVYVVDGSDTRLLPTTNSSGVGFDVYIDTSKIRIEGKDVFGTGGTFTFYYYIFYDKVV